MDFIFGKTPFVTKFNWADFGNTRVGMKMEAMNPFSASIKERIAFAMINDAIVAQKHDNGFVEASSGNTGIALAAVSAQYGLPCHIFMPESMPVERRNAMLARGAILHLVDGNMTKAKQEAALFAVENNVFYTDQFSNPANPRIHYETTGPEIVRELESNGLTAKSKILLVAGVGTGGHITGVGRRLKEHFPKTIVIAVEPAESRVLSSYPAGKHGIFGIGAGFIPAVLDRNVVDGVIAVSTEEARQASVDFSKNEGFWVGISTGANLAAIKRIGPCDKTTFVTFCYDRGENNASSLDL